MDTRLGRKDSNPRSRDQNPLPYHLATPHCGSQSTARRGPPRTLASWRNATGRNASWLCSFLWQEIEAGATATTLDLGQAMVRLLRSEDAHFIRIWERAPRGQRLLLHALAQGPGRPLATEFRRRYGLGSASSVQKALAVLVRDELAQRDPDGRDRIAEPFLAEWIRRRER